MVLGIFTLVFLVHFSLDVKRSGNFYKSIDRTVMLFVAVIHFLNQVSIILDFIVFVA